MTTYTVLIPPDAHREGPSEATLARTLFVKDGFCWPALFLAIPWLLFRRLWLVLLGYLVFVIVVEAGAQFLGDMAPGIIGMGLSLLFAFEANNLRRWTLERRGWRMVAVVEGRNREEAEIRFFAHIASEQARAPVSPTPAAPSGVPAQAPRIGGPKVVGFSSASTAKPAS